MSKKSVIILKISFLSFLSMILLGIMFFFISDNWFFSISNNFKVSNKYKLVISETYNLADINSVNFDLSSADLEVRYHKNEDVLLEIFDTDKSKVDVSLLDNILNVTFNKRDSFCFGFCFGARKVILYLPDSFTGKLDVISSSGDIDIVSLNSDMNIVTTSGDVKVLGANKLDVETISGEIVINNVSDLIVKSTSGDIELDNINRLSGSTTSGELNAFRIRNHIDFDSVSGDIDIDSLILTEISKIHTVSGDVEINGINKIYVNTNTMSGDVEVNSNDRTSEIELKIKTTSGDIEVN